jgi:hypothetical protein
VPRRETVVLLAEALELPLEQRATFEAAAHGAPPPDPTPPSVRSAPVQGFEADTAGDSVPRRCAAL